jgi:hypothetical protein
VSIWDTQVFLRLWLEDAHRRLDHINDAEPCRGQPLDVELEGAVVLAVAANVEIHHASCCT